MGQLKSYKVTKLNRFRVKKRIENFAVLDHALAHSALNNETRLLQNARGSGIVREGSGEHPMQLEVFETIIHERSHDFGHDALTPEFFGQPVTKFRRVPVNIFAESTANSAG